ncbi:hypothetical protein JHK85_012227 [Glycine max]|nr:hypothetical protein JHK85_012227 [Glycine max]
MSLTLQTPPSTTLSSASPIHRTITRYTTFSFSLRPPTTLHFNPHRSLPLIRASNSSINAASTTELDAVSAFSEIVPDTVVFDDFEKFPPTAATVSSSLLLGICGLPDTIFRNAVEMALADSECYGLENPNARLSCFVNKAFANIGSDMAKLVPGRVSTEVDARLAYDTHAIIRKECQNLSLLIVQIYKVLIKLSILVMTMYLRNVCCLKFLPLGNFAQAAAAAQAGASVIQIFVGRIRDWARNHSGDTEIESAQLRGEDPGLALVTKAYNYIHKYGHKSKLMAAAVRNKQDLFSLLGVDYIIAPLKVLQSLKESVASPDEKYSFVRRLSPQSAAKYTFSDEELVRWDEDSLSKAMGPAAVQLLAAGLDGHADQAKRVEELFGKIWPPPNV